MQDPEDIKNLGSIEEPIDFDGIDWDNPNKADSTSRENLQQFENTNVSVEKDEDHVAAVEAALEAVVEEHEDNKKESETEQTENAVKSKENVFDEENVEFDCNKCGETIPSAQNRFHCSKCDFDLCEDCYFRDSTHQHTLETVRGVQERVFVESKTKNTLYLGNSSTAIPKHQALREKHNIKAVLTLLEIEPTHPIYPIYSDRFTVIYKGIVYHNIPMPDVTEPKHLPAAIAIRLLPETTSFINAGLQHGNVLVHCELGKRRSPTMVAAYLATQRMTVDEAIGTLGYKWSDALAAQRPLWMQWLRPWSKLWAQQVSNFTTSPYGAAISKVWSDAFDGKLTDLPAAEILEDNNTAISSDIFPATAENIQHAPVVRKRRRLMDEASASEEEEENQEESAPSATNSTSSESEEEAPFPPKAKKPRIE